MKASLASPDSNDIGNGGLTGTAITPMRAGVERRHHLQAGRVDQQRAVSGAQPGFGGQVGGQLTRPLRETLVRVVLLLAPLVVDEPEEGLVRRQGFPHVQMINERLHRRSHPLSGSL
jgi:hypothetical protein